jgi:hypothetical protein
MAANPFIIDAPAPVAELIDREDELATLLERLEAGASTRISAPRRYGKTTLQKKLLEEADRLGFAAVFVDFFGILSIEDVIARIDAGYEQGLKGPLARWFAAVRRELSPGATIGTGPVGVNIRAGPSEQSLRALHSALDLPLKVLERSGKRTVAVFDEFQEVLAADDGLDGLIRSRIQHHGDAATYVFAGSQPGLMAQLFGSRERPLYGQARPLDLGPLDDVHLGDYISSRFDRTGKGIAPAALERLLDIAAGHPQRAMLLAHHLWEATARGKTADEVTFSDALEAAMTEIQDGFERTWEDLSATSRRVLAAIAWIGRWGQGDSLFSSSTLARFHLSKGSVQDARDALIRRGDLQRIGEEIRFTDPLFELWIASIRRSRG